MTVEELESLQRHPRFPARLVPMLLAELKRQRANEEGARAAAERVVVQQAIPQPRRIT
jgi:hypothetical protein